MGSRHVAWILVVAMARTAAADDADTLTAQGEELAKAGEYTRAIDLWKRADTVKPSAHHACLIGLAYTRRELWSEAEIFFDRCERGATPADPLPEWFAAARTQLDQKLHAANIAEVDIRVVPETAQTTLAISSFPSGETFAPRKIHLVPGTYQLSATAPGYWPVHVAVTPKLDAPTIVTLTLEPRIKQPSSRAPWLFAGAGVLAAGGVVFHVLAARRANDMQTAAAANDAAAWDRAHDGFALERGLALGCYGVAAAAAVIGVVMHVRHAEWVAPTLTTTNAGTPIVGIEVVR